MQGEDCRNPPSRSTLPALSLLPWHAMLARSTMLTLPVVPVSRRWVGGDAAFVALAAGAGAIRPANSVELLVVACRELHRRSMAAAGSVTLVLEGVAGCDRWRRQVERGRNPKRKPNSRSDHLRGIEMLG